VTDGLGVSVVVTKFILGHVAILMLHAWTLGRATWMSWNIKSVGGSSMLTPHVAHMITCSLSFSCVMHRNDMSLLHLLHVHALSFAETLRIGTLLVTRDSKNAATADLSTSSFPKLFMSVVGPTPNFCCVAGIAFGLNNPLRLWMIVFTAINPAVVDSVSAPKGKYDSCVCVFVSFFLNLCLEFCFYCFVMHVDGECTMCDSEMHSYYVLSW
jgi:hypothetical protein